MSPDPVPAVPAVGPGRVRHSEVLAVPLRWWALSTTFHVTVFVAFVVALPLAVAVTAVAAMAGLTSLWFLSYGRAQLVVTDTEFRAGRAQIPVRHLTDPRPLSSQEAWRAAGPDADARAFLLLRPYLREAVMVQVADPGDPVPYWLVSTRRPAQLAAALQDALALSDADPVRGADAEAVRGSGVSREGHRAE